MVDIASTRRHGRARGRTPLPRVRVVHVCQPRLRAREQRRAHAGVARYVLFLNPTRVGRGDVRDAACAYRRAADDRPGGREAARRRRGACSRAFGDSRPCTGARGGATAESCPTAAALAWPPRPRSRPLRPDVACDWTIGSFMLARREALLAAGFLDERFFFSSDEPDLCVRITPRRGHIGHPPQ